MAIRPIDANTLYDEVSKWPESVMYKDWVQSAIANATTLTPPNEPRMINADKLAKRIAGHSNYHGDSILAAIYCAAEGKENDAPIRPIETPPNEWVSVDERLPEKRGEYIVCACDEGEPIDERIWGDTVVICADYYDGTFTWYEGDTEYDISDIVTHWMPLPAPPGKEDQQ